VTGVPVQAVLVVAFGLTLGKIAQLPAWPLPPGLPAWALPVGIFVLLALNNGLDTLRLLSVARGRRGAAWLAGFTQSVLFITAVAGLLSNLDNPWNLAAFCAGFASGSVLGILVEARLAPGHRLVRIVSSRRGAAIADALRQHGWGATEFAARGQDGMVTLIWCHVPRRQAGSVTNEALDLDPEAFVTAESVRLFQGGWRA
jgi:uncharacterized protein YebE (UPF0316 family)